MIDDWFNYWQLQMGRFYGTSRIWYEYPPEEEYQHACYALSCKYADALAELARLALSRNCNREELL